MINQFFINKGPFNIDDILKLCDIPNSKNYSKISIKDIKDLETAEKNTITFFHAKNMKF